MASSAWLGLWWREWETAAHIGSVVLLFFLGGLIAFPVAMLAASWLARRWYHERRFATAFVILAVTTIGATAAFNAIQYRLYYSEWHDARFSVRWIVEVGVTTAAATYQFAVLGMSLYLPVGFLALVAASLWFARRSN